MKKSQLRNIIRQVIREQLDVEKNKLRPIEPIDVEKNKLRPIEPIDVEKNKLRPIKPEKPPKPLSTPNSHYEFRVRWCEGHGTDCYEYTYNWQWNNPSGDAAIQCNGQMCTNNDLNKTYSHPTIASGNPFELLWVATPAVCTAWECRNLNFISSTGCPCGCMDPTALNYDPNAVQNDNPNSCTYPTNGCMDPNATNYDPSATINDCVCTYGPPQEGVIQPGGSNNKCADPNANNYASNANYDCNGCYLTTPGDGSSGPMSAGWDSCCTYGEIEYGYQCSNVGPCAMQSQDPNHPLAYDPFNPQYGAMSSFPYTNPCGQGQQSDPDCYYGGGSSMQNLNDATEACTAIAISNGWDIQDQATQPSSCPATGAWAYPYDGTNVHPL